MKWLNSFATYNISTKLNLVLSVHDTKVQQNSQKLNSQYIAPNLTHQKTYIFKDLSKLQFSCTHISPFIDEKIIHKP
jgi:hypothetical protein